MRFPMGVALLATVMAFGCKGGDTGDSATEVPCTVVVRSSFPTSGATDAYYRTIVEATLSAPDPNATITLAGPSGDVAGTSSVDGTKITFQPSAALTPSTAYTATVTWSCNSADIAFTTSEVGGAVAEPSSLVGKTYNLSLTSGYFLEPAALGTVISGLLDPNDTPAILIGVTELDGTTLQLAGALGEGANPTQNVCDPTIPFPEANFSDNPYFEAGPAPLDLAINAGGESISLKIDNLFVAGSFAPDASYIAGAELQGVIDVRPLIQFIDENSTPEEACATLVPSVLQAECGPCADGQNFCIGLHVIDIDAQLVSGLALEEIGDPCVDNAEECAEECTPAPQ